MRKEAWFFCGGREVLDLGIEGSNQLCNGPVGPVEPLECIPILKREGSLPNFILGFSMLRIDCKQAFPRLKCALFVMEPGTQHKTEFVEQGSDFISLCLLQSAFQDGDELTVVFFPLVEGFQLLKCLWQVFLNRQDVFPKLNSCSGFTDVLRCKPSQLDKLYGALLIVVEHGDLAPGEEKIVLEISTGLVNGFQRFDRFLVFRIHRQNRRVAFHGFRRIGEAVHHDGGHSAMQGDELLFPFRVFDFV